MKKLVKAGCNLAELAAAAGLVDAVWRVSVPGAIALAAVLLILVAETVNKAAKK